MTCRGATIHRRGGSWGASGLAARIVLVVAAGLIVVGCEASNTVSSPTATVLAVPSIPGVSPACAAAYAAAATDDIRFLAASETEARLVAILRACSSRRELNAAALALPLVADGSFVWTTDEIDRLCQRDTELRNAPLCALPTPKPPLPTATPAPTPPVVLADEPFQQLARERCEQARPKRLYQTSTPVSPLEDPGDLRGVHVLLVEFRHLEGSVSPEPALKRGYVYRDEVHSTTTSFHVRYAEDVDLLACLALRATERERWGTPGAFGRVECPCYTIDASDALIWMVDVTDGDLVGEPWMRPPPAVGTGRNLLLHGEDGPGIRPPPEEDIVADIEAFLGL